MDPSENPVEDTVFAVLPMHERLRLATQYYRQNQGSISARKVARLYGVKKSTFSGRLHGAISKAEASQQMQRLSPAEERSLAERLIQLDKWGWPTRVDQLRLMAAKLLQAKNDNKELGVHWTSQFLQRNPLLKTKFVSGLNKERAATSSPEVIASWFDLYTRTVEQYQINISDTYNMDERGFLMGVLGKSKVVVSKHERRSLKKQCGSCELVSVIECVSATGQALSPFVIFKANRLNSSWAECLKAGGQPGHVAISENGWTNNELGIEWLTRCFHPETTTTHSNMGYRLLIYDGHASHITPQAIDFCIDQKIIPLCLPPHSTHLLQPLDLGIFGPFASYYRTEIEAKCRFSQEYTIDTPDFLDAFCKARLQALSESTILSTWERAGLSPLNPTIYSTEDTLQPSTSPILVYTNSHGEVLQTLLTPSNVQEIDDLLA